MRLPRVRFTVRRLMALVALVAVVLAGASEAIRLKRRRDAFLRRAWAWDFRREVAEQDAWELRFGHYVSSTEPPQVWSTFPPEDGDRVIRWRREVAAYCGRMRVKYERAAARSWRPVAPDPPPPDIDERLKALYQEREWVVWHPTFATELAGAARPTE